MPIGGGGNLFSVTLAPGGIGVYLTRPPAAFSPPARRGHWFATLELNLANLEIGGNATPTDPTDPGIPSPNDYRAGLRAQVATGKGVDFASESVSF